MADDETPENDGDGAPDEETAAAEEAGLPEDVPSGYVRVKANANLTLGGVFIGVGEEGDVPDGAETRQCVTLGLLEIVDDPIAAADAEEGDDDGEEKPRRARRARSAAKS